MQTNSLRLLVKYLYDCKVKAHAHGKAEAANRKRERLCTWSQSILSLIVGVTSLSAWNNVDDAGNSSNVGLIATGVILSFTSAAIGATRSTFRYGAKESEHHACAGSFADIASDIELFFSKSRTEDELDQFIDVVHEKMDIHVSNECPVGAKYLANAKELVGKPANGVYNPLRNGVCHDDDSVLDPSHPNAVVPVIID